MLAVSPLINTRRDEHRCLPTAASTTDFVDITTEDWPDFSAPCDENESTLDILEGIDNFDDLFVRIGNADVLPDLEMDPKTLGEYSGGRSDEPEANKLRETAGKGKVGDGGNKDGAGRMVKTVCGGKNKDKSQVKKKLKVDWTSELHRKFVKAVEQLGMEKAVPSRILEIMNVHFLTRHNIASHLQKYRSHRKHLLAREGEVSRWNLRRKATVAVGGKKAWTSTSTAPPVLGYPTMRCFGPLHVWGHPTWPQHNPNPNPPSSGPPSVPPPTPLPSYWPQQPFYPQGYGRPSSNNSIQTPETSIGVPLDFHPSNESIDTVIRNVISNPWLPLPLGLKPPSLDGTMTELQRQGIFKIPPPLD